MCQANTPGSSERQQGYSGGEGEQQPPTTTTNQYYSQSHNNSGLDSSSNYSANGGDQSGGGGGSGKSCCYVRLFGLPFKTVESEIVSFLDIPGLQEEDVKLVYNSGGKSTGVAFIKTSEQYVDLALRKDKEYIGNRYVEVRQSSRSEMDKEFAKHSAGQKYDSYSSSGDRNFYASRNHRTSQNGPLLSHSFSQEPSGYPRQNSYNDDGYHAPSYQQHANENYDSYPNDRSRPSNSWSPNFQPGYAQPYHHSPSAPNQQASGYRAARDAYSDRGYDAGHDNRYYNAPDRAYPAGAPSSSYNNNNANYGASSGRYYNSSNNNANYGNSNAAYLNHPDSMPRRSDRESKSSEYVCKVRGLPFSATPSDIYDFFSGLSVENVHMCPSLKFPGENDGHAFVFMNTAHDLAMAKKRHRNLMGRRYIEVMSSSMDDFLEFQEFMATSSYQSKAPFKSPELDNPSRYSGGKYQSPNYRDPNYPSQQPQQPPVQRTTYYSNPPESKSNFHQNANTVYGQQQSPRISNPNYGNSFPSDRNLNSSGEYPNASFQSNRSVSNFIRTYK